jgi:TRAP-type transport system periplasmic protein
VALFAMLSAGCTGGADAATPRVIELKLGHVSSPGSLISVTAEEFVRRVNEELAGEVRINLFGSGQLGSDEVLMIKLKLGTVDLATTSTVVSSTIPSFGFFELPYLIRDRDHLRRIEREIFWPHIAPNAAAMGFEILALWEHGFRQITNNARPIVTPEDLRGIKLRTPSGFWRVTAFQTLGAHPTPMPLTEVFVGLQTGVLDGQENPLHQIYASRFQEVQRYLSLTNHVYSPVFVTVGAEKWAKHPPHIRETIERIAREMQEFSYAEAERMDRMLAEELERGGMQVNQVNRESFIAASRPVYDQFGRQVPGGQSWVEMALALEDAPPDQAVGHSGIEAAVAAPSGN